MNNYLEKGFFIIEEKYKQLSMLPNDLELTIHAIEQLETFFVMAKNKAIYSVENTIKKLHIQSDLYLIYKKIYHDKQDKIDILFDECHVPLSDDIDNTELLE